MKKIVGYGLLLGAYGILWWSYEALTGRVAGSSDNNAWLPSLTGLFVPGRLAAPRLDGKSGGGFVGVVPPGGFPDLPYAQNAQSTFGIAAPGTPTGDLFPTLPAAQSGNQFPSLPYQQGSEGQFGVAAPGTGNTSLSGGF